MQVLLQNPAEPAFADWTEIEANTVGCSGSVLVFSQTTQRQQTMQGPAGLLVQGMAQETRIVLVAQAIDGVLVPLARPVPVEDGVLELEGRR